MDSSVPVASGTGHLILLASADVYAEVSWRQDDCGYRNEAVNSMKTVEMSGIL
jgi:hypothetical protein